MDQPHPDIHYRLIEGRIWPHVLHRGRYLPIPAGGDDGDGDGGEGDAGGDDDGSGDDKPLGPAGEKALDAYKQRARDAEKRAKAAEAEAKKLRDATASDAEKALNTAREEADRAARAELEPDRRALRLENAILRAAGNQFVDIEDAVVHLRGTEGLLDDDGQVDAKALGDALKQLLERKPHLAAATPTGGPTKPPASPVKPHQGGSGGGGSKTSQERADAMLQRLGVKTPAAQTT